MIFISTVEHTYDTCPKYSELGSFRIIAIFMLAMVAAADSASTVRKKYSVFIYSEAEPQAMDAIYKQTRTLCVLQYLLREPESRTCLPSWPPCCRAVRASPVSGEGARWRQAWPAWPSRSLRAARAVEERRRERAPLVLPRQQLRWVPQVEPWVSCRKADPVDSW